MRLACVRIATGCASARAAATQFNSESRASSRGARRTFLAWPPARARCAVGRLVLREDRVARSFRCARHRITSACSGLRASSVTLVVTSCAWHAAAEAQIRYASRVCSGCHELRLSACRGDTLQQRIACVQSRHAPHLSRVGDMRVRGLSSVGRFFAKTVSHVRSEVRVAA